MKQSEIDFRTREVELLVHVKKCGDRSKSIPNKVVPWGEAQKIWEEISLRRLNKASLTKYGSLEGSGKDADRLILITLIGDNIP